MSNTQGPEGQPPAAWVWSQYRGELPESPAAPPPARTPAPKPPIMAQGGASSARTSSAMGLGIAATVIVIAGLTWLFTSRPASAPAEPTAPAATESPAADPQKSEATPAAADPAPAAAQPEEAPKAAEPAPAPAHPAKKKKHKG